MKKLPKNMKKQAYVIGYVILLILALFSLRFILGGSEDTWICQDGEWVRHGMPSAAMPSEPCGVTYTPTRISDLCQSDNEKGGTVFLPPLNDLSDRMSLRPFGIFVFPGNSPVPSERFRGFHTGMDIEILPGEEGQAVPVRAICEGELLEKRWTKGYGGLLVQACKLEGEWVQVIYGHLEKSSMTIPIPEIILAGEEIGVLGQGGTVETHYERKHLHLGIKKGTKWNIHQHILEENELGGWVDPCLVFPQADKILDGILKESSSEAQSPSDDDTVLGNLY
jgi:hypothetical protein